MEVSIRPSATAAASLVGDGRLNSGALAGAWVVGLRLVLAAVFLQSGLEKLAQGGWTNPAAWSARGFLLHGVADANPLRDLFLWFAEVSWLVDPLVIAGEVLVGLALLLGVLLRLAAVFGSLLLALYWTAAWQGGLAAGLPVEQGYVIDSAFVYLLVLVGIAAVGGGRILGLDARLERTDLVRARPRLGYLLG